MPEAGLEAYTFAEFAHKYRISLTFLYELIKRGDAPRTMKVGNKRLISAKAAADWVQRFEDQAESSAA